MIKQLDKDILHQIELFCNDYGMEYGHIRVGGGWVIKVQDKHKPDMQTTFGISDYRLGDTERRKGIVETIYKQLAQRYKESLPSDQ